MAFFWFYFLIHFFFFFWFKWHTSMCILTHVISMVKISSVTMIYFLFGEKGKVIKYYQLSRLERIRLFSCLSLCQLKLFEFTGYFIIVWHQPFSTLMQKCYTYTLSECTVLTVNTANSCYYVLWFKTYGIWEATLWRPKSKDTIYIYIYKNGSSAIIL